LVEDNPADVLLIREALNENGVNANVTVVRDGEAAFGLINELEGGLDVCPDLVILDLNLPRKSGREILQLMRGGTKCGRIPVVILTSSNAASDRNEATQLGATRYLRKPSNLEEFMQIGAVVQSVLSGPVI
jgi:CheY-like chemotaxis protein